MARPKHHNVSEYRSGLESRFQIACKLMGWNLAYEQDKLKYEIPASMHTYTPDFTVAKDVYIETKGLWTAQERKKACLLKEQHPNVKILYVLLRNQKISKNSKTSYLDWGTKHGLDVCTFNDRDTWTKFIATHVK